MEQIKRANKGGFIRTVSGHVGIILGTEGDDIIFMAQSGAETRVYRGAAFRSNQAEYDAAVAAYEKAKAEEEAEAAKVSEEQRKKDLARKEEAEEAEEAEEGVRTKSIVPEDYKRVYVNTKSANGRSSKRCGDRVSQLLEGKTLEEAAEVICGYTGWDAVDLLARYSHLNPGQRRMNIGNRFRTWIKESGEDI